MTLRDFADRRQCSREILINTHITLDQLMVILCAAVGFSETEHLYTLGFAIPQWPDWMGVPEQYAHPYHASTIDAEPATQVTLADAGPKPGSRLYMRYDFGDDWRFHGRFHQVPKRVAPALWAHARLTDTPAAAIRPARQSAGPVPARRTLVKRSPRARRGQAACSRGAPLRRRASRYPG